MMHVKEYLHEGTRIVEGTLDDYAQHVKDENVMKNASVTSAGLERFHSHSHGFEFTGTHDFNEARDLALRGWKEGAIRIADLRDELMAEIGAMLPEEVPYHDVEGVDVDIGAFVDGVPECMLDLREIEGSNRQIRLLLNVSASAFKSRESLMMRGLLAAGIVDSLEMMGNRVTLDVVSIHSSRSSIAMLTHVKRAQDVLDIERIAFACGHPSMLRRINFAIMESRPEKQRKPIGVPGGYGRPVNDYKRHLPEEFWPDIYIGDANHAESMLEVRDSVIRNLKEVGVLRD